MLVELIDPNRCSQKVSSRLCHSQISTDEGLEGQWGIQGAGLSLLWPSFFPFCDWVSTQDLALLGWLMLGCREGSILALETDIPGQDNFIGPPLASVSSLVECRNSRLNIYARVLLGSLRILSILLIIVTKISIIDNNPKVRCLFFWQVRN